MIVYDLKCRRGHVFEAWFHDSAAYEDQAKAGGVVCPTCGSKKVAKAPMAPRVSKGGPETGDADRAEAETSQVGEAMRAMQDLRRKVEENFDYVGNTFSEEARRIHYGETDPHSIYGETSDDEARALRDEGVSFARVPWPARHDS